MAIVRGRLLCFVLAASLAVVVAMCPSASASGLVSSPWPQTAGNAALNHANLTEHTLTPGNVKKVRLQRVVQSPSWPPPPPQGDYERCANGASAPVLSGGFVYTVIMGQLSKINGATGVVQWAVSASSPESESVADLAVVDGIVVVDSWDCVSQSDPWHDIKAFDAATGALRWRGGSEGLGNTVVSDGYVVTIGWGLMGSWLEALNLRTGAVAWSKSAGCHGASTVAVVHRLVTYDWCNNDDVGEVDAARLATGAPVWSVPGGGIQAGDSDTASGYNLFTSGANGVIDRNPVNGKRRFTLAGASQILAVGKSYAFATCSTDGTPQVCGYSMITGALKWSHSGGAGSAALANSVLYLSTGEALRQSTGMRLTTFAPMAGYTSIAMAVGDGRLAMLVRPWPQTDNPPPDVIALYGLPNK